MSLNVDATWANAPDASSEPVYDAADLRRADAGLIAGDGTAFAVRGGIAAHGAGSLVVTVDGSDQVTIAPGAIVIAGDAVSGGGVYRSALPAAYSENLTARHATLGRIDLVVFRMLDIDVVGSHTARSGRIEIIAGAPSGSPAVPVKPSMAVELARITVPASSGGAATVDSSRRTFATGLGGQLLVTTASQLPAAAAPWQRARALDTGASYTWDPVAGAWDDGTWKTYTPALTNITVGSGGTVIGRYRVLENKTVKGMVRFVAGAGSAFPGGNLLFGLPPVAMRSGYDPSVDVLGAGNVNNNTSASRQTVVVMPFTGLTQFVLALNGGLVTSSNPFSFGTSSRIGFDFEYEAA